MFLVKYYVMSCRSLLIPYGKKTAKWRNWTQEKVIRNKIKASETNVKNIGNCLTKNVFFRRFHQSVLKRKQEHTRLWRSVHSKAARKNQHTESQMERSTEVFWRWLQKFRKRSRLVCYEYFWTISALGQNY